MMVNNDDFQSTNCSLLGDDLRQLQNSLLNVSTSSSISKSTDNNNNNQWPMRNNGASASCRRYRSPFRRGASTRASNNSQYSSSSFPLFRRFYLMHNSFTRKRQRLSRHDIVAGKLGPLTSAENIISATRIEVRHVYLTILITSASACLLTIMLLLDFAYLDDAIPKSSLLTSTNSTLCFRYPKVCAIKSLLIIVFIGVTMTLCYNILTLYSRARHHSLILERKTDELEKEKILTEKLLHQILPPCVAKDLINGRKAPAEYYDSVTVYFSDIVGFTLIASMCTPTETCEMLNRLYSIFDSLLENFDVYKVETIGDAYMVASGAPEKNGDKHPNEIANMSLALLKSKRQVRVPRTLAELKLRVGIHTGPVCAAVIGSKMPRYCMFGDTVNVASRMESTGLPEKIHLSDDTYRHLKDREQYVFEDRGEVAIKGKGHMRTYFLLRKASQLEEILPKSRTNTLTVGSAES